MTTQNLLTPPTLPKSEEQIEETTEGCNFHIALAEAGRVGKSTVIKHLAEYLSRKGQDYEIADTDRGNSDVAEGYTPELWEAWHKSGATGDSDSFAPQASNDDFYEDPISDLLREQIYFSEDSRTAYLPRRLMKLTKLTPNLLVNIPANSYQEVTRFLKSNSVGVEAKSKIKLFNWWVSDGSYKSLNLFLETKLMFPAAHHILVLNQGRSDLIKDFGKYRWPSSLHTKYEDPMYKTSEIKTVLLPELLIDLDIWYAKDGIAHNKIIADPLMDEFDLIAVRTWQSNVFKSIEKTGLI
jgi:hypothetical protein